MPKEKKKLLKATVVLGSLALIVAALILVDRLKRLGYVDSAIGSLRVLVNSEIKSAKTHPDIAYACTLSALPNDDLTAELIKNGRRNEYTFEVSCPQKRQNDRTLSFSLRLVHGSKECPHSVPTKPVSSNTMRVGPSKNVGRTVFPCSVPTSREIGEVVLHIDGIGVDLATCEFDTASGIVE